MKRSMEQIIQERQVMDRGRDADLEALKGVITAHEAACRERDAAVAGLAKRCFPSIRVNTPSPTF
jgi:hypothetical protein